jgi:hypothetical protein
MPEPDASADLLRMTGGAQLTQAIYVAAKLSIADMLADGPRSDADLAASAGAHPASLLRLLRFLASAGLFAVDAAGRYGLTPLSQCLRDGVPGSLRATVLFRGEPWAWAAWGDLLHSVRTGEPAFEHVHGMDFWAYTERHPEAGAIFNASRPQPRFAAVLAAYDFAGIGTLVDVGGGWGQLLAAILPAYPALRGVLFDLPQVVAGAAPILAAAGVADRCVIIGGDFFTDLPDAGDAYILAGILHDWGDAQAVAILRACHDVMAPTSRLLVLELLLPPGVPPRALAAVDLTMLVLNPAGARQRTEAEFHSLFAQAGFALTQVVPTATEVFLLEGTPH